MLRSFSAKTITGTKFLSLIDLPGYKVREWFLVYHWRHAHVWWGKWLKPAFRHVELTRPIRFGPGLYDVVWLQVIPSYEGMDVELCTDSRPPWVRCPDSTIQKVTSARLRDSMRSWFDIGPTTCVEVAKQTLGIRAFWVRTPFQLFKHVQKHDGVFVSGRNRI